MLTASSKRFSGIFGPSQLEDTFTGTFTAIRFAWELRLQSKPGAQTKVDGC
jgi:hypothetical protein